VEWQGTPDTTLQTESQALGCRHWHAGMHCDYIAIMVAVGSVASRQACGGAVQGCWRHRLSAVVLKCNVFPQCLAQ